MNSPLLTILLPVHNGASLLPATLESVFAQSFAAWELLVIDDGSTDATPEILRAITDPRLRVLTNGVNCGLTASLNRGLAEARGELIARQDADDLSTRERFEKQIARFREQPALVLLGSSAWRLDPDGRVTGTNDMPATHPAIRWASVTDNPFLHTSVMFRRDPILREHGGYDESFSICQDYELWNRIAARHRVANLRQHLVGMREHPRSMTQTRALETSAEVRRLLEPNWAAIFPHRRLTREEGDLLALFRLQLSPAQSVKLRKLLDILRSEFVAAHPASARDRDFRATLCRQSLRLAYKSLRRAPPLAGREILRAFIESPREWLKQAGAARFHLYPGEWPR